jgi:site-specific recombinase XerD
MDDKQSLLTQTQLRFIKSLGGRNLSTHTATAYETDIRQFLTWLTENDMTVDSPTQITRTHILDYLSHLAGSGKSGVTRARKLAAIREYCKFLVLEQILPTPLLNILSDLKRSASNGCLGLYPLGGRRVTIKALPTTPLLPHPYG